MKLLQLAQELNMDPGDLLELLMKCPKPIFEMSGVLTADPFSISIPGYRVEEAREFALSQAAHEVIDHVKKHGTEGFKLNEDTDWDEEDPPDSDD